MTVSEEIQKEMTETLAKGRNDFRYFVYNIFAKSFDHFIGGAYIDDVCDYYFKNQNTARISARDHFKSTGLYAVIMHDLLYWPGDLENHYFSYMEQMAGYHIAKVKHLVERNVFFRHVEDLTRSSQSRLRYAVHSNKGEFKFTLEPHGMLAFKRGIHAPRIYVDDPFQDPENKLLPTVIKKINDVFVQQIMDMVMAGGRLHVAGTPQTNFDFFFDKEVMKKFAVMIKPAVVSYADHIALWPEHMDFDELMDRKQIRGKKVFNQEYMCSPVYSEDSFLKEDDLQAVIDPKLQNYKIYDKIKTYNDVIAGFDIGKKSHPSHLAVFEQRGSLWYQIHSKFMDGWDYAGNGTFNPDKPTQVEYLMLAIENLGIDRLFYDNTRAEFESLAERGILPGKCEPVVFTSKEKASMAAELSVSIENKSVRLLDDQRQREQLLMVTNDLKALETPMGHGDSFWSIALAHKGMVRGDIHAKSIYGSVEEMRKKNKAHGMTGGLMGRDF
jgi:hypothetical protein